MTTTDPAADRHTEAVFARMMQTARKRGQEVEAFLSAQAPTVACETHPDIGRSLIVNTAVDTQLKKDASIKLALNIAGTEVLRQGKVPNIAGFGYNWTPNLPTNGENLIGFAAFASAILCAFAPVNPAAGVRSQLVGYQVVTDPETGIAMNWRHWGNAQADRDYEVIECAYGFQVGETSALKRIVSPS